MISQSKKNTFYAYMSFSVWPFFGLVYALRNIRSSYLKNVVWLFIAFYGFTFNVSNTGMDANRYRNDLERLYERNKEPYMKLLTEPYVLKQRNIIDVYARFITLSVSRFTDDFRILMTIVGLVFGFFYSRSVFYILEFVQGKRLRWSTLFLLLVLSLIIPIWSINGYRFFTAAIMFVFAVLRILVEKRYKFLWIALLTPLVHFSFLFPLGVLGLYLIVRNRIWIYAILLLGTLFASGLNPEDVSENIEAVPEFAQKKAKSYSSETYVLSRAESLSNSNWYVAGSGIALNASIYMMIVLVLWRRKKYLNDMVVLNLFSFGLLMLAAANGVSTIPSMGRFFVLGQFVLIVSFIYILTQHRPTKLLNNLFFISFIPLILYITVAVRIGFDMMGLNTLFLNPWIAWAFTDSPALIEFIK